MIRPESHYTAAEYRRMPGVLTREERTMQPMDMALRWWLETLRRYGYRTDHMPGDLARAVTLALKRRGITLAAIL